MIRGLKVSPGCSEIAAAFISFNLRPDDKGTERLRVSQFLILRPSFNLRPDHKGTESNSDNFRLLLFQ